MDIGETPLALEAQDAIKIKAKGTRNKYFKTIRYLAIRYQKLR